MKRKSLFIGFMAFCALGVAQAQEGDLEAAFLKEFAFLENQKQSLTERLKTIETDAKREQGGVERDIERLESRLMGMEAETDRLNQRVLESERALEASGDHQQALLATYDQAAATLSDYDYEWQRVEDEAAINHGEQLGSLFISASGVLSQSASVNKQQQSFFLEDGRKVEGDVIRLGRIAAYGIADAGAGMLAPAGGGQLKLWSTDSADAAQALQQGNAPQTLPVFLFESLDQGADAENERGLLTTIQAGGGIAWIIVGLGVVALVMILLRARFLREASTATDDIVHQVSEQVGQGQIQKAINTCESQKGATSRVMAAALRNIDRDREHIEDIISESILHESLTLNRFGAIIIVIAAVSPLLGLLGTVTGMIATFDVITQFGTGDPKLLSGGISVALITTQLGLIVAIPTLIIGNLLTGWSNRVKDDMEKAALRVINLYGTQLRKAA